MGPVIHEKSLLAYWASEGHNAVIIFVTREGYIDPSAV
jgi:hypothetical protein